LLCYSASKFNVFDGFKPVQLHFAAAFVASTEIKILLTMSDNDVRL